MSGLVVADCPECGPITEDDLIQGRRDPIGPDDDGYTEDYYCGRHFPDGPTDYDYRLPQVELRIP